MPSQQAKQISVLSMNTLAFTACFAIWVIFSIIGIPIKNELGLSETQFGLLAATPILTGSLFRLPLGMATDKFGGKSVYFFLMMAVLPGLLLLPYAKEYWHFLFLGLCVGVSGASFSVGIAYTARWFTQKRQGFAMGIFGAGNAGASITKFVAPSIVVVWGWQAVPHIYAGVLTIIAILFWFFTYEEESHKVESHITIMDQLRTLRDPTVWKYCQYYSLVFGGFVGLSLWMTKYYMGAYGHDITTAALLAAIFVLPSGIIRALGGWLSDRYGAHRVTYWVMWTSMACLFVMSYPPTDLTIQTSNGPLNLHLGVNEYVFTALLFVVGIAWGFGKASVFKYLSDEYQADLGVMSGIVGLIGGLGGFFLPIMFGILLDLTGIHSSAFMLLFGVTLVSYMWMQYSGEREKDYSKRRQFYPPSNKLAGPSNKKQNSSDLDASHV